MDEPKLSDQYVPNALLEALYERAFSQIQVEDGWAELIRKLSRDSSVLYVLPNLNWLDFLALDYLTKQRGLPPIRFANDLGLWVLNPVGPNARTGGLRNMLMPGLRKNPEGQLRDAITQGGSAALFLKRPPGVLDVAAGATGGRGVREGEELVRALFRMQKEENRQLVLLPLVFVWSKSPDKVGVRPWDYILGPHAWPTPTRAIGQFAYNLRYASLRWGQPITVSELLKNNAGVSEEVLVRRVTYMVLRRIERERRAVIGPAAKAPERVRTEILRSPRLGGTIADLAHHESKSPTEKTAEARRMLEELQATPNPTVLRGMGIGLRWGFNKIYRGIEFDRRDVERVRDASRDGTLILLPSHKSHIDYLVLSYFFYERNLPMPVIAAGDNLNFKPVGPVFRRCGAFFIRRSFKGDRLYAAVVEAYIRRLIRDGYPIELFLEGGRSRTGKLLDPKFGLLNMIVDAAQAVPAQKVHFVPVSIGYERVVEADTYQRELTGGEKKKEDAADLISASEVLRSRYGRINLQFGQIMTLEDIFGDLSIGPESSRRPAKRRAVVTRLGNRVMDEINRVTAVTPGSLTALSILADGSRAFSEARVIENCGRLLAVLKRLGARITSATVLFDGSLRGQSIRESLQMFVDAQLLDVDAPQSRNQTADDDATQDARIFSVIESRRVQLDTSKNIIVHFFVERALVASAFDRNREGQTLGTQLAALKDRVLWASRLFKHEFRFRADATFDEIFSGTVEQLVQEGHVHRQGDVLTPGPGEAGWDGQKWLQIYRAALAPFFEGYGISAKALSLIFGEGRSERDLVKQALGLGNSLYLDGLITRREAISKPVLQNAFRAFTELGFVRSREGRVHVHEAFQSQTALAEVQNAIFGYLSGHHEPKP